MTTVQLGQELLPWSNVSPCSQLRFVVAIFHQLLVIDVHTYVHFSTVQLGQELLPLSNVSRLRFD